MIRQYSTFEKVGGEDPSNKLLKNPDADSVLEAIRNLLQRFLEQVFVSTGQRRCIYMAADYKDTTGSHIVYMSEFKNTIQHNCSTDVHANTAHGNSLKAFKCSLWSTPHKGGYEFVCLRHIPIRPALMRESAVYISLDEYLEQVLHLLL